MDKRTFFSSILLCFLALIFQPCCAFERDLEADVNATHVALDEFVGAFWEFYILNLNFSYEVKNEITSAMNQVKLDLEALQLSETELTEINSKIDLSLNETNFLMTDMLITLTKYIVIESKIRQDLEYNLNNLPNTLQDFRSETDALNLYWLDVSGRVYILIPQDVNTAVLDLIAGESGPEVESVTSLLAEVRGRYGRTRDATRAAKSWFDAEATELDDAMMTVVEQLPAQ